ncbi:MAG: hypothetical protein ACJ8C4_15530 [Gemmataceae bacterium]
MPIVITASILSNRETIIPLLALCASNFFITLHCSEANDGSDQMAMLVVLAATIAEAFGTSGAVRLALLFICGQASLAYGTSGILKAMTPGWYDGHFVVEVLRTGSYGHARLRELVENRRVLATLLGCLVMFGDCAFAVAWAAPPTICLILLCGATLFHFGVASVLGLNTFLWSFAATFPATMWLSQSIYNLNIAN